MTEQLKAEAWVRSQRPALMKLSFGCEVELQVAPFQPNNFVLTPRGTYVIAGYYDVKATVLGEYKIIGHQPELQDWLAALGDGYEMDCSNGQICKYATCENNQLCLQLFFNLTTGQPNSPEDYKRFNEITSV